MRNFKSFIAVMAAMLMTVNTVGAATLDKLSVVQNVEGGKTVAEITVSGTGDEDYVSLSVINPGMDEADLENGALAKDVYHLLKNVRVVDGKYTYTWVTNNPGEYTLKVEGAEGTRTLLIMSKEDIEGMLTAANGTKDAEDVVDVFENLKTELGIEDIAGYKKDDKKLGAAIIADAPFDDAADAIDSYKKNAVALIIANPENEDAATTLIDLYAGELALAEVASFADYEKMDEDEKNEVAANVAKVGVTDADDFKKVFGQQIILTSIDNATSYGEVEVFFGEKYEDIFETNWKKELDDVKSVSEIYKELKGNYYKDEDALLDAVKKAVKEQKKEESKGTGSSGGGGGGSSFGGMATNSTTAPTTTVTPASNTGIFNDLGTVDWAKNAIYTLADKGILNGVGNGEFAPDAVVTREQFIQGIVKAFGFTGSAEIGFADVKPGDWFYDSVCIAYANGIVSGVDAENFGVGKTLTREEMASLVYRAMLKKNASFGVANATFIDMDAISAWAVDAANAMYAEGIISGFPTGEFGPRGECTRAQMAVVLEKAMSKI